MNELLKVTELKKSYPAHGGRLEALCGVSLTVAPGEILGVVGASGCGKSTLLRLISGLERPDGGEVLLDGKRLSPRRSREEKQAIQMVFQDAAGSLHPRLRVRSTLADSMDDASAERMAELCEAVGIEPEKLDCYPSQLSGGQCQRFAIARALASSPRILLCDEPTSALDVLAQARILTLLKTLCSEKNMAMIFVSHDLAVVSSVCDRVLVMKDGRIVEEGAAGSILSCPKHEYTRLLIDSVMGEK